MTRRGTILKSLAASTKRAQKVRSAEPSEHDTSESVLTSVTPGETSLEELINEKLELDIPDDEHIPSDADPNKNVEDKVHEIPAAGRSAEVHMPAAVNSADGVNNEIPAAENSADARIPARTHTADEIKIIIAAAEHSAETQIPAAEQSADALERMPAEEIYPQMPVSAPARMTDKNDQSGTHSATNVNNHSILFINDNDEDREDRLEDDTNDVVEMSPELWLGSHTLGRRIRSSGPSPNGPDLTIEWDLFDKMMEAAMDSPKFYVPFCQLYTRAQEAAIEEYVGPVSDAIKDDLRIAMIEELDKKDIEDIEVREILLNAKCLSDNTLAYPPLSSPARPEPKMVLHPPAPPVKRKRTESDISMSDESSVEEISSRAIKPIPLSARQQEKRPMVDTIMKDENKPAHDMAARVETDLDDDEDKGLSRSLTKTPSTFTF